MKIISDKMLVKYCKEGVKKFCNQIFKRHSKLIFYKALKMTGDPPIAEEMTQETFLSAYRAIKDFREEASLKNWLIKIVINKCMSFYRSKEHKLKKVSISIDESNEDDEGNSRFIQVVDETLTGDTLREIGSKEDIRLVKKAISKLSDKLRIVYVLDLEGHSYKEISEMTGVKLGTVKSRISNARKRLAEIISQILSHKKKEPHNEE